MNTSQSVYPSALADKCVALLCTRQRYIEEDTPALQAGRYLMILGLATLRDGQNWQSLRFAVLSPDTPRFYYAVDLAVETCTCADFLHTQRPCKHLYAAALTLLARRSPGLRADAGRCHGRAG
jgi:SWIM zinc finger